MTFFARGIDTLSVHCPKIGRRFNSAIRIIQDTFDAHECSTSTANALLDEAGFDDIYSSVGDKGTHEPLLERNLEDLATGNATCLLQSTFPTLRESYVPAPLHPKNSLDDDWVQVEPCQEQRYSLSHRTYRLF